MNIGAAKALRIGNGRVFRNWRLWLLFYFLNFAFASVLTVPVADMFAHSVAKSVVGSDLLKGFSYRWYVEFVHANSNYFVSLIPQFALIAVLYILMEVFLAGGFYSAFSVPGREKVRSFVSNGASRFFQLFLVTIAEAGLLALLYIGNASWAGWNVPPSDLTLLNAELYRYAIVAVLFLVINVFLDFVRSAVTIDEDRFFNKLTRGIAFVLKHPLSTFGVYLGGTIVSGLIIGLFVFVINNTGAADEYGILVEMAAVQIFVLLRIYSKLIFYAGEATLYKENQIEVINVKLEMLE